MKTEVETKFRLRKPLMARQLLKKLGAEFEGKVIQNDSILDFPDEILRKGGCVLRVREEIKGKRKKVIITFKSKKKNKKIVKVREEIEFEVNADKKKAISLFERLGLEEKLKFKKTSERFHTKNFLITIDSFPKFKNLKCFMEIELKKGNAREIGRLMKRLELKRADIIEKTYPEILQDAS